jgi:hypothetical protein
MGKGQASVALEAPEQSNSKWYLQTSFVDLLLFLAPTPDSSSLRINAVFR